MRPGPEMLQVAMANDNKDLICFGTDDKTSSQAIFPLCPWYPIPPLH
jgi:hypothetical protein